MAKSVAYLQGYNAGSDIRASMACPYSTFSDVGQEWMQGWTDGDKARRAKRRA